MKYLLVLLLLPSVVLGADEQSNIHYIMVNVLSVLIPILGVALVTLVLSILTAVAKKYHLEVSDSVTAVVKGAVETAVHKAEAWADSQKDTPSSSQKLNMAVGAARQLLNSDIGKNLTDNVLSHYVEEAVKKVFNSEAPATTGVNNNGTSSDNKTNI